MGCIYKITNTLNSKSYIGLTTKTAAQRWKKHVTDAINAKRVFAIHNAIVKCGASNFKIETLFESSNLDMLNEMEQKLIDQYDTLSPNGYNLHTGGEVHTISELTKYKMSQAQIGKKQSDVTKKKRSLALIGRKQLTEHVTKRARSRSRAVVEINSGLIFDSVNEAAKHFKVNSRGISKNLHSRSTHYFGNIFKFVQKEPLCK